MHQNVVDDRYALIELLGRGGMAKVYLARDTALGQDVALKVLREQYVEDEKFVERFRREAQNAARPSHPNIVSVYRWGRSADGIYYMAMEYVPRGTLKDRLKRGGALSPATAVGVALQIADALRAAHEGGVIHRDVKPQNVLVTGTGDVKLADFGVARAAWSSAMTTTGTTLGTATHVSPEQALGKPVDARSDLYSLGVVLYEMLTGMLPYDAETHTGMALMHVREPVRSPREASSNVPEVLDSLTIRLLAKEPEDRYPSAAALVRALERVRSNLPPAAAVAVPSAPTRAPVRRGRRRRVRRLSRALISLLLGAGLLGGLVSVSLQGNLEAPQWGSSESSVESPNGGASGDAASSAARVSPETPVQEQKGKGKGKDKGKQKGKGK